MVLSNIKPKNSERGFTIVELLIVIVVIAILATITIVAYSGITSRTNTTKAQTNASNAQKVAEAFNADNGRYPGTITDFTTGSTSTRIPSGITVLRGPAGTLTSGAFTSTQLGTVLAAPLSASNGLTSVAYSYVGASATTATGGVIIYWDFTNSAVATSYIYVGSATATSTFVQPGA